VPLALVVAVSGVVDDCKVFDGGWVGSTTTTQIPKVTAYAWVEIVVAVAPKGRMFVVSVRNTVPTLTSR
jgi:hypothetical protein